MHFVLLPCVILALVACSPPRETSKPEQHGMMPDVEFDGSTGELGYEDASDDAQLAPSACSQVGSNLPLPGEPCTEEGKSRCTNAGAEVVPDSSESSGIRCLRPNRVVCKKSRSGLVWEIVPCPPPPDACNAMLTWGGTPDLLLAHSMVCEENEFGAGCCPHTIGNFDLPGHVSFRATLCDPQKDVVRCTSPLGEIKRCQFLSQPLDTPALESSKMTTYATCAAAAMQCRYWLTPTECAGIRLETCFRVPGEGATPGLAGGCVDFAAEPPRCATSCQDLEQAGYPAPAK